MFTGIISHSGEFISLNRGDVPLLIVKIDFKDRDIQIGDSIAVNGACLTAVAIKGREYHFNLSQETLQLSNFGDINGGDKMNIELPLTMHDFLSGHLVSGHLDGVARVKRIKKNPGSTTFSFLYQNREWKKFLVPKGSVAVNGISLTLTEVTASAFSVEVIPHTLAETNLNSLKNGTRVNIELDLIGKYLYNLTPLKR